MQSALTLLELAEAALQDWTSGMFVDGFVHLGSDEAPSVKLWQSWHWPSKGCP